MQRRRSAGRENDPPQLGRHDRQDNRSQRAETYPSIRKGKPHCDPNKNEATTRLANTLEADGSGRPYDMVKDDVLLAWQQSPHKDTLGFYGVGSPTHQPESVVFNQVVAACLVKVNGGGTQRRIPKQDKKPSPRDTLAEKNRTPQICKPFVLNRHALQSDLQQIPHVQQQLDPRQAFGTLYCTDPNQVPHDSTRVARQMYTGISRHQVSNIEPARKKDPRGLRHPQWYCPPDGLEPRHGCTQYEWAKRKLDPNPNNNEFRHCPQGKDEHKSPEPLNYDQLYSRIIKCFEPKPSPDPLCEPYEKCCKPKRSHGKDNQGGGDSQIPKGPSRPTKSSGDPGNPIGHGNREPGEEDKVTIVRDDGNGDRGDKENDKDKNQFVNKDKPRVSIKENDNDGDQNNDKNKDKVVNFNQEENKYKNQDRYKNKEDKEKEREKKKREKAKEKKKGKDKETEKKREKVKKKKEKNKETGKGKEKARERDKENYKGIERPREKEEGERKEREKEEEENEIENENNKEKELGKEQEIEKFKERERQHEKDKPMEREQEREEKGKQEEKERERGIEKEREKGKGKEKEVNKEHETGKQKEDKNRDKDQFPEKGKEKKQQKHKEKYKDEDKIKDMDLEYEKYDRDDIKIPNNKKNKNKSNEDSKIEENKPNSNLPEVTSRFFDIPVDMEFDKTIKRGTRVEDYEFPALEIVRDEPAAPTCKLKDPPKKKKMKRIKKVCKDKPKKVCPPCPPAGCQCEICHFMDRPFNEQEAPFMREMRRVEQKRQLRAYYRQMRHQEYIRDRCKTEYRAPRHQCDPIYCSNFLCQNPRLAEHCDCLGAVQELQNLLSGSKDNEDHSRLLLRVENLRKRVCQRMCDCILA